MDLTGSIFTAGLSLLILVAMFRPLELAFPAKREQRLFRPHWWTDLCFLLGQYLVFNSAVFWVLTQAKPWLYAAVPDRVHGAVNRWPIALQLLVVIAVGDLLIYWGHRLQHRVGFLWRFHAVHHSAEHLDWLAAHREHPIDSIYTIFLVNAPIFALGFSVPILAGFAAFRGLWAIFIHANVRVSIGPLKYLIGAPALHHWHHDRDRDAGNYGNVSPLMDLLFGTYRCPDHEPTSFGLSEPYPQSYLVQLIHPLRRQRRSTAVAEVSSTVSPGNAPALPEDATPLDRIAPPTLTIVAPEVPISAVPSMIPT